MFDPALTAASCPLCGVAAPTSYHLSAELLNNRLAKLYPEPPPLGAVERDYSMHECRECAFSFAWPMEPGNAAFYSWITRQPNYYPAHRWEWGEVLRRLAADAAVHPVRVLEIGCGSGVFLSQMAALEGVEAFGLDTTPSAIAACRDKSLNAYLGDLASIRESAEIGRFDYCISFHCLEHVERPLDLIEDMGSILTEDGKILISAPLSPMSFERFTFDVLNHPPHHLSRWTTHACEVLGQATGFATDFSTSPAENPITQAVMSTLRSISATKAGRARRLALLISNPHRLAHELWRELREAWQPGGRRGDTLLVEFSRRYGVRS